MVFARGRLIPLLLAFVVAVVSFAAVGTVEAQSGADDVEARTTVLIGVEDGLPTSEVTSIVEDADGVMWFGTSGGVTHWNGTLAVPHFAPELEPFGTIASHNSASLVADAKGGVWATPGRLVHIDPWSGDVTVLSAQADRARRAGLDALWLWEPGAVFRFDLTTRSIAQSTPLEIAPLRPGDVPMEADALGDLFVGTRSGVTVISVDGGERHWSIPSGVTAIAAAADGDMLAAGVSGLWRVSSDRRPERITELVRGAASGEPAWTPSSAMIERSDGSIWVGDTTGRIHVYRGGEWSEATDIRFDVTGEILTIVEDSDGGLWISQSGTGVLHVTDRPAFFQTIDSSSLVNDSGALSAVTDLEYADGSLIAATRGSGLHRFDLRSEEWQPVAVDAGRLTEGDSVLRFLRQPSAVAVSDELTWAGTWGHGLFYIRNDTDEVRYALSSESEFIYDIVAGRDGTVWVSTWGFGVQQFDRFGSVRNRLSTSSAFEISNDHVRAVLPLGDVVVLGGDAGIDVANLETGTTRSFSHGSGALSGQDVVDIYAESTSVLWVATDAGLERLDLGTGTAELFGLEAGVAASPLVATVPHQDGDAVWLVSSRGVTLFDLEERVAVGTFTTSAGLPDSQFVARSSTSDADGVVYLAAATAITRMPSARAPDGVTGNAVFVRCVDGCGDDFDGQHVKNRNGQVSFELLTSSDFSGRGAELEYRLTPHDDGWVRSRPGEHVVVYRGLEVGEFRFEARLVAAGSTPIAVTAESGPGGALSVIVDEEWWRSGVVRTSGVFGALLVAGALVWLRLRRTRRRTIHLAGLVDERTAELKASTVRALEASDAKTRFLSMVTHDFRSPLTSVVGYADLLEATHANSKQAEWAAAIRLSAEHLSAMIDDILHFTASENSSVKIRSEPTLLGVMCFQIVEMFRSEASSSQVVLTVDVDERVTQAEYFVDERRLRQVLINLTSNALRHSGGREFVLGVSLRRREDASDVLRFTATDDGQGIPAGELEGIFEPWHRAEGSLGPGLGLGLAISNDIVELLGGELGLDLSQGVTEFSFELALRRSQMSDELASHSVDVLIVDDDEFSRQVVSELLLALGYNVEAVESAEAALTALRLAIPSLVLTDIMMPELSGVDLARSIRSNPDWDSVPIIAMTGVPDQVAEIDLFGEVLDKPFGLARLRVAMRRMGVDGLGESGADSAGSSTAEQADSAGV